VINEDEWRAYWPPAVEEGGGTSAYEEAAEAVDRPIEESVDVSEDTVQSETPRDDELEASGEATPVDPASEDQQDDQPSSIEPQ
jgi:hypothetical protein